MTCVDSNFTCRECRNRLICNQRDYITQMKDDIYMRWNGLDTECVISVKCAYFIKDTDMDE